MEALVAFLIVAIGLQSALGIFANHIEHRRDAAAREAALGHAESLIAQTVAISSQGSAEGDLDGGYRWRTSMAPLADRTAQGRVTPYVVLVEVSWRSPAGPKSVVLRTVRLLPTSS